MKTLRLDGRKFQVSLQPGEEENASHDPAFRISLGLVSLVLCKVSLMLKPVSYGFYYVLPGFGSKRKCMILLFCPPWTQKENPPVLKRS